MTTKMIKLPIDQKMEAIKDSFRKNQITIIETPTGSGKTMRSPFWAHLVSNKKVHCLVPRVVMAKEAAKGAAITTWNTIWCRGREVGYATGRGDVFDKRHNKCLYMTEGSFIQRKVADNLPKGSFILIDEVHEQGSRTEALLVLAKEWAKKGLKIVLMSATMDVDKYKNFYTNGGFSVGTISLPPKERPYPLEGITVGNPLGSIVDAAKDGGRCLIGVEGKAEIAKVISDISYRLKGNTDVKVFPFHGELEKEDIEKPLNHKGAMIVVATNVLQSGVTIEGLTHGYFNGKGKRIETVAGRSALKSYDLSKAEMTQWFGRIGRTCKGVIFQSENEKSLWENREGMPTPEILRTPLEETLLMFKNLGLDISETKTLNQPPKVNINLAEKMLRSLKLCTEDGGITDLGRDVFFQGVGLRAGIVQVLGKKLGLENTTKKVAALMQKHPFRKANYSHYRELIKGYEWSDYMAWITIIDDICSRFGYKVKSMDRELFRKETEGNDLFRRALVPLMRAWMYIDDESSDEVKTPSEVKSTFQGIMKAAYADTLIKKEYGSLYTEDDIFLRTANSSQNTLEGTIFCGDIISIQTRRGVMNLLGV